MLNKEFYQTFEDRYRGSRELIKAYSKVYLPFVLPLQTLYPDAKILDIGCGRGEWLEILKNNGIKAQGIDYDENMLKICHKFDLNIVQGDGVEYLKQQPNESLIVVSALHVIEHISFEDLQSLVQEALRVLKPGGILIMETPNPENIKVATENFYLDPTHIKPIPSNLLSFLPEFHGYKRTKVLRLHESKELAKKDNINILDIIGGISPDYAVIAQKDTDLDILKKFDDIFSVKYGLDLATLTDKFENRLINIEAKVSELELRANDALHHYHSVVNSNSRKIMKPFRLAGKTVRWLVTGTKHWVTFSPTSRPKRVTKQMLVSLKHHINSHPRLKMNLLTILNRFPTLKARLRQIGQQHVVAQTPFPIIEGPAQLSPRAKKIYNDLKNAIELQKGNM